METSEGLVLTQHAPADGTAGFWRGLVRTNCFYILSAALMIYGCYRLMDAQVVSGNQFARTLNSLLLLQGYELLVILTSIGIVRWFTRLGDAFTLFVIEMVLLLDATFFANNFHSMVRGDDPTVLGVYTNIGCFVLVPVKLLLLRRFLALRFTPAALHYVLGAACFVYLLTWPLVRNDLPVTREEYYHLLLWLVPLLALVMPGWQEVLADGGDPARMTAAQRAWLPRLFLGVPGIILLAHLVETVWVHELNLHGASFAALPIAGAIAVLRLGTSRARLLVVDGLSLVAIGLSLPSASYILIGVRNDHSDFLASLFPFLMTIVLVGHLYLYAWACLGFRGALLRFGALAGLLVAVFLLKTGLAGAGVRTQVSMARAILEYVAAHWRFLLVLAWFAWLPVWIHRRGLSCAMVGGIATILIGSALVPGAWESYKPEILQAFLIHFLVCLHVYAADGAAPVRRLFACLILLLSVSRFVSEGAPWCAWVAGVELAALLAAGLILWERVYLSLGLGVLVAALGWKVSFAVGDIPPEYRPVLAGLVLFVAGFAYTVAKEKVRCLRRYLDPSGGDPGRAA